MRTLMAIGGGIDHQNPEVLREFVRRAGGEQARLAVLPQASDLVRTGADYADQFRQLGAGEVSLLDFQQRDEAGSPANQEAVRRATGIFFTGGTQMRISVLVGGTPLQEELLAAYQRGCLVGGTSAGASILCRTMVADGRSGPTPRAGMAQYVSGLGFTDRFTFDQHFRQKDRIGRLIYIVTTNPGLIGVGMDENTAVVLEDDERISVVGAGGVTIVDGRGISASNVAEVENGKPVAVAGLTVHVLTQGGTYDRSSGLAWLPLRSIQ